MTGMWITTTGLILCILITWTCALPFQRVSGGDLDSDEADSDEDEGTTQRSRQNVTDQELTNKATLFLTRYFSNHGTEIPLHIPTNLNHTIVITVVPNNASSNAYENFGGTTEGAPTFVGDIPFFPSQQQQYAQASSLQQQHPYPFQGASLQQPQQFQEVFSPQQFQEALSQHQQTQQFQGTFSQPQQQQQNFQGSSSQPQQLQKLQGASSQQQQQSQQFHESSQKHQSQDASSKPKQQPSGNNLTPTKDLFGFVRQEQIPHFATREATEQPTPSLQAQQSRITTTTTTTTTTAPPKIKEEPVDNIEDAILEALSIAGGEGGQGGSASLSAASSPSQAQALNNFQALLQSGAIPGLSNSNGLIHVPSNFGSVVIQAGGQSTVASSGGTVFVNSNTPAPASAPIRQPLLPSPNEGLVFLQNAIQRPGSAVNAVSGILGSISEGNLSGVVQNSIKFVEAPAIQNTAKLATVAVLHNIFQGLNPCNFLGNCRPRQPQTQKKL